MPSAFELCVEYLAAKDAERRADKEFAEAIERSQAALKALTPVFEATKGGPVGLGWETLTPQYSRGELLTVELVKVTSAYQMRLPSEVAEDEARIRRSEARDEAIKFPILPDPCEGCTKLECDEDEADFQVVLPGEAATDFMGDDDDTIEISMPRADDCLKSGGQCDCG